MREWTGGSRRWPEQREVAAGDVLLYVARGGLEVDLDGEIHALEEGDALLFDGGVPHRVRRTGGVSTRALKVARLTLGAQPRAGARPPAAAARRRPRRPRTRRPPPRGTARPAGGRVGEPQLRGRPEQARQQRQQQLRVAALVEQVGAEHEVPRRRSSSASGAAQSARSTSSATPLRSALSRSSSIACGDQSVATARRRRAPRRGSAAPARSRAPACARRAARAPRRGRAERQPARPQLRPVGQELLVLEGVLVDQRLRVARAQDVEIAPAEHDRLLHQVELWQGVAQAAKAGRLRASARGSTSHERRRRPGGRGVAVDRVARAVGQVGGADLGADRGGGPARRRGARLPAEHGRAGAAHGRGALGRARRPRRHAPVLRAHDARRAGGGVVGRLRGRARRRAAGPPARGAAGGAARRARRRLHLLLRRAAGAAAGRRADRRDRGRARGRPVGGARHRGRDRRGARAPDRARAPADRAARLARAVPDVPDPDGSLAGGARVDGVSSRPRSLWAGSGFDFDDAGRRGRLLDPAMPPTAIICDDDILAGGVYLAPARSACGSPRTCRWSGSTTCRSRGARPAADDRARRRPRLGAAAFEALAS